jgi:hypothetical protein
MRRYGDLSSRGRFLFLGPSSCLLSGWMDETRQSGWIRMGHPWLVAWRGRVQLPRSPSVQLRQAVHGGPSEWANRPCAQMNKQAYGWPIGRDHWSSGTVAASSPYRQTKLCRPMLILRTWYHPFTASHDSGLSLHPWSIFIHLVFGERAQRATWYNSMQF